ncbi:shikimate kinase [Gramella sp. GC03-9]|uniref:Shikimate kinase n=1 Tax=Christiangramia oceanisediminis TaxID=2920386 RepID=A0A9X2KZS3_9FLAO|nr:shikimate kinase [Gramella oceanisediminis]MCP9201196.1 shikimate kinase [Gramella oceanisediminis]
MRIFLIGYMGSGKSFIGKRLAERIEQKFIDFDEEIEKIENLSISEIFQQKGEIYFRKLERKVLEQVLSQEQNAVISLGGGTPCYGDNMELIREANDAVSFYLKLSVQQLTERLFSEKDERPVIKHLQNKEELEEFIRKHLFERGFYYNQADHVIDCGGKDSEELITEITNRLR